MSSDNSITITRALVELKTLDARIKKAREGSVFITYQVRGNAKAELTPSNLQKVNDLMDYRKRLKGAIVQSNAKTQVNIDGETYSVAEAIERKNSIDYDRQLLAVMRQQWANAVNLVERHNINVQKKLDRLLEVEFGKDVKSNVENMERISESYLSNNKAELVDTMDLKNKMDRLENSIMNFEKEVDLALSESNATTRVTV